ncbi:MAG TPA: hypothetical protein VNU01_12160, partial [Egibacteraceae bacterium]|nr:hypothetical protein [Egibacteraceae bacterium]
DCADRSDVGVPFPCTVTASVANAGPHPDAVADVLTRLELPPDCAASSPGAVQDDLAVSATQFTTVVSVWTVACGQRSFHPITAHVDATLDQLHVQDPDETNDSGSAATVVEIFEAADLAVLDMDIACDEYADPRRFSCVTTTTVTNHGVADGVATRTVVDVQAPEGCAVTGSPATRLDDLDAGETADYVDTFAIACHDAARHVVHARALIRADEPHAEDRDATNDRGAVDWLPIDIKPGSFPNAVNVKQKGLIPVAVLSTPTFDAPAQVVASSLRFGATGIEESWVRCGAPEDVDGDGLADLVCHFDATLTGFDCSSTVGVLTGRLLDGTAFESQYTIKVTPCRGDAR